MLALSLPWCLGFRHSDLKAMVRLGRPCPPLPGLDRFIQSPVSPSYCSYNGGGECYPTLLRGSSYEVERGECVSSHVLDYISRHSVTQGGLFRSFILLPALDRVGVRESVGTVGPGQG